MINMCVCATKTSANELVAYLNDVLAAGLSVALIGPHTEGPRRLQGPHRPPSPEVPPPGLVMFPWRERAPQPFPRQARRQVDSCFLNGLSPWRASWSCSQLERGLKNDHRYGTQPFVSPRPWPKSENKPFPERLQPRWRHLSPVPVMDSQSHLAGSKTCWNFTTEWGEK